ncbi:hypothetical protein VTO42DRAFT_9020 [Malbranchea cinnamomea]
MTHLVGLFDSLESHGTSIVISPSRSSASPRPAKTRYNTAWHGWIDAQHQRAFSEMLSAPALMQKQARNIKRMKSSFLELPGKYK